MAEQPNSPINLTKSDQVRMDTAVSTLQSVINHAMALDIKRGSVGVRVTVVDGHLGNVRMILESENFPK